MNILILGAGVMQTPALKLAREMGLKVFCADGNAEAVARGHADVFLPIDLKDIDALLDAARKIKDSEGLAGVFTAGTDFSASVAYIAENLGLPGIKYETALKASNKLKMRTAFEQFGVSTPRFFNAKKNETGLHGKMIKADLQFPVVVKPCDSMGARGCRLAADFDSLIDATNEAITYSRSEEAIIEEYIDGPEFSIDALVFNNRVIIRGLADRHIYFKPYFVELGHTMPSTAPRHIKNAVIKTFTAAVAALGIDYGVAKGDIKWSPKRRTAVVGEIAARLSGGYMSGWTYPYSSGIEVTAEALQLACGIMPDVERYEEKMYSAERAVISIPGLAASVSGIRDAEMSPFVKNVFLSKARGSPCVFPTNNVEKCGNIVSQATSLNQAIVSAEEAARKILIRLAPKQESTEKFLAGAGSINNPDGSSYPPPAYHAPKKLMDFLAHEHSVERGTAIIEENSKVQVYIFDLKTLLALHEIKVNISHIRRADHYYYDFAHAIDEVLRITKAKIINDLSESAGRVLGVRFWNALIRGGIQGGLYVIDSEKG